MTANGIVWVVAANLVVWTGLFLYLLRLDRRLSEWENRR
jgi:CcmD family protein